MLDRIKLAARALAGKAAVRTVVKDVEVAVVGDPNRATLYRVGGGDYYSGGFVFVSSGGELYDPTPEYDYFATCEQAHAAAKGGPVKKVEVIRIGAKYFVANRLREVRVGAKPKKPKGKK